MITGIDTSRWEDSPADPRTIDWKMAVENGARFVIMKATEGTVGQDPIYQLHKKNLAGVLPRASFHYLRTQSTPEAQATFYRNYAGILELPPSLDVEDYYNELPRGEALYNLIAKTLGSIDYQFGQKAMLYTSPNIIKNYLGYELAKKLTDRKLWIAHYGVASPEIYPWTSWTFWQFTEAADAHKYGITESAGVDANYYPGTIEDFNQEFGLSEITQDQGDKTMNNSNLAHGIELDENTGKVDITQLENISFGIVYGGSGWSAPAGNLKDNVQYLYNANLPCILLWDIIIPPEYNASDISKTFPPENEDPNIVGIKRALANKTIHGVMIRFLDKDLPDKKVFTQGWMANLITYLVGGVYKQTGRLLYVMTSQAFIDSFGTPQACPQLNQVISGVDGMCSWKSAFPGQAPQEASWKSLPIPPDGYAPEFISNNKTLYFINYARTAFCLPGILDKTGNMAQTPLWQYKDTAEKLKEDLGYKDHPIIVDQPDPGPEPVSGKKFTLLSEMNIRTGPGVGFAKVGKLPAGSEVEVLGVDGSNAWIEIEEGKYVCAALNGINFIK